MNGIEKYLAIAELLVDFFKAVGYCDNACHSIMQGSRVKSCCGEEICRSKESELEIFRAKISENNRYRVKPNSFLSDTGCILGKYKPVHCTVYACKELEEHIKDEFDISFDHKKLLDDIEFVHDEGGFNSFDALKKNIENMIFKVKKQKNI